MDHKPKRTRKQMCFTISYFYCDECGTLMTVPRTNYHIREKGHKKNIWCPKCKKVQTMIENRFCDHSRNLLGETLE